MSVIESVPATMPTRPDIPLPPGAWDCHAHVFGPLSRFPTGPATYAIPLADPDIYVRMLTDVGFSRGVLVQPAPYASDHAALENALLQLGGRVRGIAVADEAVSDSTLRRLHAAGVRGLRFIEMRDPRTRERYAGSVPAAALSTLAPRMKALGWHAQIWAKCVDIPALVEQLGPHGIPLVFDHMGQYDTTDGIDAPAFQEFIALLRRGEIWTKLTVCRLSSERPDYDNLTAFHRAVVNANPERLLWGSDWPFVRMGENSPDVGRLTDLFQRWVGDAGTIKSILVENPQRLFDFET